MSPRVAEVRAYRRALAVEPAPIGERAERAAVRESTGRAPRRVWRSAASSTVRPGYLRALAEGYDRAEARREARAEREAARVAGARRGYYARALGTYAGPLDVAPERYGYGEAR